MSYINTSVKQNFTVLKSSQNADNKTLAENRKNRNIEILHQIKLGDFSQAKAFSGFGGLRKELINKNTESMLQFLSKQEIASLKQTVSTGYFTPSIIIDFIYALLDKLGFTQGRILEPSCGNGAFFDRMPTQMQKRSTITGIELDVLTAQITKHLYPSVHVVQQGFQDFHDSGYDLILGNPPYAAFSLFDSQHPDLYRQAIHHYFVAKSVRLLNEGGLLAMVVPTYVLDNQSNHARHEISKIAELVMAFRLPENLFLNAKVTVDVVIFQRKKNPNQGWVNTGLIELTNGKRFYISNYFIDHPEHILSPIDSYEVWLQNEQRIREGIRCQGISQEELSIKMKSIIEQIKPIALPDSLAQNQNEKSSIHEMLKIIDQNIAQLRSLLLAA